MFENNLHIRPNYIDFAKVIGMFLVIFAHYYYYYLGPKLASDSLLYSIHTIQLFHMPLFFVISGFLYKGISSNKEELTKIWKKLCVPYILICSIAIASCFVLQGGFSWHKIYYTIIRLITGYDFPIKRIDVVCGAMWFVYALIIIRLLYMAVRKCKYILYLAILSGLIIMHCGNCLPFRLDSALVGFLFFSIGCYGKKWISLFVDAKWWQKGIVFMLSMFILILVGCVSDDFNDINQSFSINAMRFGKYPLLFLFSGVAGTIIILLLGNAFTYIHTAPSVSCTNFIYRYDCYVRIS